MFRMENAQTLNALSAKCPKCQMLKMRTQCQTLKIQIFKVPNALPNAQSAKWSEGQLIKVIETQSAKCSQCQMFEVPSTKPFEY